MNQEDFDQLWDDPDKIQEQEELSDLIDEYGVKIFEDKEDSESEKEA